MSEKLAIDATVRTAQAAEQGVENVVRKAWSILDAASAERPSQFLSPEAIRAIQGEG